MPETRSPKDPKASQGTGQAAASQREHDLEDEALERALALHQRRLSEGDLRKFEGYLAEIFTALGLDLSRPATAATPRRFLRALLDATEGYEGDPKLITVFQSECRGGPDCQIAQLVEGPIPFFGLCEHHARPIVGMAYVGYIAHTEILGLSKLTRLVRIFARRFTGQERLGQQIAEGLIAILQPHGVAVYLEAAYLCMEMRGVRATVSRTRTTVWRGEYERSAALRAEFFVSCGLERGSDRGWI